MSKVELTQLIAAGAHFGHLTRRWNPKMKPYIFMERNGIHIIDLKKTQESLEIAANRFRDVVASGKKVLFVGTKKQAKGVISDEAKRCEMNWVSERWLGGMLTNFATIRKSIKRLQNIEKMESDGTFEKITKKERLQLSRERDKLRKVLDGVEFLNKLPGALFIVDIKKEFIAVKEAHRLNIPVYAIVDTNCDPDLVDYVIPANDDAVRAIEIITKTMADAVIEGSQKAKELKAQEDAEKERTKKESESENEEEKKSGKPKVRRVKFDQKGEKQSEKVTRKKKSEKNENDSKENAVEETDKQEKETNSDDASQSKEETKEN
ncbi:MAG: 30S ribosomal protein S2 [Melioribacteraceae bacterium]|nr:30S ribosomal protein S2 [Melioribacteraceae bacterium]MCO6473119.1 30S ribosomal protein S2 [Melioribacteraceae bacterium]